MVGEICWLFEIGCWYPNWLLILSSLTKEFWYPISIFIAHLSIPKQMPSRVNFWIEAEILNMLMHQSGTNSSNLYRKFDFDLDQKDRWTERIFQNRYSQSWPKTALAASAWMSSSSFWFLHGLIFCKYYRPSIWLRLDNGCGQFHPF